MNRAMIALLAGSLLAGCQETRFSDVKPVSAQPSPAQVKAQRLEAENADLAQRLTQARQECAALEARLAQAGTDAQALRTQLEAAQADSARQKELLAALDPARVQARLAEAQAKSQAADEQARKWEIQKVQLEKDLLRQERELAVLRAELARRDAEVTRLQAAARVPAVKPAPPPVKPAPPKPAPAPATTRPAPGPAGPAIRGEIIQARADMARASVGSAAGVKQGDKLPIYRGRQLVGYLHVAEVTTKESAGFVVDRKIEAKVGDQVVVPLK